MACMQRRNNCDALGVLFHDLSSISDEHTKSKRVLENSASTSLSSAKLLDHLGHGHPILLTNQIQETKSVVLSDEAC